MANQPTLDPRAALSAAINAAAVADLVDSFEQLVTHYRAGNSDRCLVECGKFVENAFRILEFLRTGTCPPEIKSPAAAARTLENATGLHESTRLLIPRVLMGMIYEVRSKKGAVHVKGIDPARIDATLSVTAASWVLAELLRLYCPADESAIEAAIVELMRPVLPQVERFGEGDAVVNRKLGCEMEILLLLADSEPGGLSRQELGKQVKYSPSAVSRSIGRLNDERFIHRVAASGKYRITGTGQRELALTLTATCK